MAQKTPNTPKTPKTPPSRLLFTVELKQCSTCNATYNLGDNHETACFAISSGQPFTVKNHGFIHNKQLYGTVLAEPCRECPSFQMKVDKTHLVYLSHAAMQQCGILVSSTVRVDFQGEKEVHSLLIAWPCRHLHATSVIIDRDVLKTFSGGTNLLRISPVKQPMGIAQHVNLKIEAENISYPAEKLAPSCIIKYEGRIITEGTYLLLNYCGHKLCLVVQQVISSNASLSRASEDEEEALVPPKYSVIQSETRIHFTNLTAKSPASVPENISLADFGGSCEIVNELVKNCEIIFDSRLRETIAPRSTLLYGPSGTGKSLLVRAVANHFKAKLVKILASDVHSKFYGETESRIREKFDEALKSEPCVIFMDEIDVLCPQRGSSSSNSDLERRVVNTLVTMLDSIPKKARVIVFGATNSLGALDRGLRTSGRLDRELEMRVPTVAERKEILDALFRKLPNSLEAQHFEHLASVTHGFVGADLYRLCSRASLVAAKRTLTSFGEGGENGDISGSVVITFDDTKQVLHLVKPSAMREVLVECPNIRWIDIGGQKELKLKLQQSVDWPLRYPEEFKRLGLKPPRGLLMFGPPGCSKTMIAKALATESGLNFIAVNGSELFSKWVGESERAVRELFRRAQQVAPAIIFLDEIDAIGCARGSDSGSMEVGKRVLTQLLTEIDGAEALENVIIVAATNRPDMIDKALLRPGRLDRMVYVPLPDDDTRREIWKLLFQSKPIHSEVDLEWLVERTQGYSGAEISAVYTEAAFRAAEDDENAVVVRRSHLESALERVRPRTTAETVAFFENFEKERRLV